MRDNRRVHRGSASVSRICSGAAASFLLAFAAGCAGSAAETTPNPGPNTTVASIMRGGPGHTSISGVRIGWNRKGDGRVCYWAKAAPLHLIELDGPASCIRHLRADEITYAWTTQRKTGRFVIVGLMGPQVKTVYLQLSGERWTPPRSGGAFFGLAPRGRVRSVVKVTRDGKRVAFTVSSSE